jgi:hypothetical protein
LGGSVIRSLTDAGRQGKGSVAGEVKSLQISQIFQENLIFAILSFPFAPQKYLQTAALLCPKLPCDAFAGK